MAVAEIYKDGTLLKLQTRKHKFVFWRREDQIFQKTHCCLGVNGLEYSTDREEAKGQFTAKRIKIVETVRPDTFKKFNQQHCFQIGENEEEIMYFAADTELEKKEWMSAFRKASTSKKLSHYHPGIYHTNKWTCCEKKKRGSKGCEPATREVDIAASYPPMHLTIPDDDARCSQSLPPQTRSNHPPSPCSDSQFLESGSIGSQLDQEFEESGTTGRQKEKRRDRTDTGETIDSGKGLSSIDETPAGSLDHLNSSRHLSTSVSQTFSQSQKDHTVAKSISLPLLKVTCIDDREGYVTFHPTKQQPGQMVRTSLEAVPEGDVPSYETEYWKQKTLLEDPKEFLLNASRKGLKKDVELAIKKLGAEVNQKHEACNTALLEACQNGHAEVAEVLIENNAEIDLTQALHSACQRGHKEVVQLLIEKKANVNTKNADDNTPLSEACKYQHLEIAELLLEDGAEVDQMPLLQWACGNGQRDVVELLMKHGADINRKDGGTTPLMEACKNKHLSIVETLLEHYDTSTDEATIVLHWACQEGYLDAVKVLFEKCSIDVDVKDQSGNTPLLKACKGRHFEIVEYLLKVGADVNEKGADDRTPLHESSEAGDLHTVELLLKVKAETAERILSIDATPYDLAYKNGHSEVMTQLRESMPESVRPYAPLSSLPTSQRVTALTAGTDRLISGSSDGHVRVWGIPGFKPLQSVCVSGPVHAVDVWGHYLAIGSNVIQMVDMNSRELRRIKFFEENESIPSSILHSHFVAFAGDGGDLVTARANSTVVNIWPPPSPDSKMITSTESSITVTGHVQSLSASHNSQNPWLAVVVREGREPVDLRKSVYLINLKTKNIHERLSTDYCGSKVSIHIAFSPDARHIAVGYGEVVNTWETRTGTFIFNFHTGASVSSVVYSNSGTHISAGLCTGEVDVFEFDSGRIFTLGSPSAHSEEVLSPVISMTYSQGDKFFVTGRQSGILQLWEVCPSTSASTEVQQPTPDEKCREMELLQLESLLIRTNQLNISSRGGKYHSEDDDFTLTVPEGAVPTGDSISIHVGVVPYGPIGPFKYPDGVRPVSPIVWFCSTPKFEFQKPIELSLPHCIDCKDEDDCRSLIFLKADHTANQGSKMFHFELTDGKALFTPNTSYGTLSTTHFCLYCVGEYTREDTDKANYCLVVARPLQMEKNSKVYFCLTYFLDTCLKLVDEQFEEHYGLIRKMVRLGEGPERALEIKIKRNDSEKNGWQFALSQKKITAKEVCFWDGFATVKELVLACERGMYPPRSILEVSGENSSSASRLEVEFDGAVPQWSTEILLLLASTTVEVCTQTDELPMVDSPNETIPSTLVHVGTSADFPVDQVGSDIKSFEPMTTPNVYGNPVSQYSIHTDDDYHTLVPSEEQSQYDARNSICVVRSGPEGTNNLLRKR